MSEKFLDFSKEKQAEIICILLSKMNPLKAIFSEKSSRSSFYLDFEEMVWEFGHPSVGNDVETAFFVSRRSFWGWKVTFEITLFRLFFFILTRKKCGRCVEDFDGVVGSWILRVQKNILRSALQKLSSFFKTFGVWIKAVGFSRRHFQRLSKVHPTSFRWQVDHFEYSFFGICVVWLGVCLIFTGLSLNLFQRSWRNWQTTFLM